MKTVKQARLLKKGITFVIAFALAFSLIPTGLCNTVKAQPSEKVVYLDELEWEWAYAASENQLYGDSNKLPETINLPKKGLCYGDGSPMEMKMEDGNTKTFSHGIGTEACSEIVYQVEGKYDSFKATIGFDTWVLGNPSLPSSVQFKVLGSTTTDESGNYTELYSSEIAYSGTNDERPYFVPEDISVNVEGYEYIKLLVWDAGESASGPTNASDTVNWADARFIGPDTGDGEQNPEDAVYLDELQWEWAYAASIDQMYEDKDNLPENINLPKKNLCYGNNVAMQMKMNDGSIKTFDRGIGTEACSEIVYKVEKKYDFFKATIGFDAWVLGNPSLPSSVQFKVLGSTTTDENSKYKELYSSEIAYSGTNEERPYFAPEDIDVNIMGYEYIKLLVWDAGESASGPTNASDTVNWANARFVNGDITYEGLQELLKRAKEIKKEDYTEESWTEANLQKAIADAEAVKEDSDQKTIKAAYTQLKLSLSILIPDIITSLEVTLDKDELNPLLEPDVKAQVTNVVGIRADGKKVAVDQEKLHYEAVNLHKTGDATVATVDDKGVITGIDGGVSKIVVTAEIDGQTVSGSTNLTVRPYYREYHQTLTMKMFMGEKGNVNMTFAEALETIKKIDNLTRGIPKIIYLVGWQYEGHDSGYPAWDVVNEKLKRPEDETAVDSLRWLMREARQYNTTVSLHINMMDAQKDSPLWDEYVEKDLIARYEDGTLRNYKWGYPICYTAEWESGMAQKRIDALIEMLPELKEGHTIHIDAFSTYVPLQDPNLPISPWHAKKYGYDQKADEETQRKILKYWRSKGVEATSEAVSWYRNDKFVGLLPMAWWFQTLTNTEYLEIPASLYCGGDGGNELFGNNLQGEDIIKADKTNLTGFLDGFALKTVPFYYLNRLDRISYTGNKVTFSNDVTSYRDGTGLHITQGNVVLRDGNNIFMPALWVEDNNEIFAYSESGYQNRTWTLPEEFQGVTKVDIYSIGLNGLTLVQEDVAIENNQITLSLDPKTAVSIIADEEHVHNAVKTEAKTATCTEDGNIEYWYCAVCGKYFADASCTQELAKEDVVLKAEGHKTVRTQAKNATCTESGNIEYWYCNVCEKYFRDANCTTEIQKADISVKPMGHDWNSEFTTDKEPTATQEGQKSIHCKRCDAVKDVVILPALGEETNHDSQIPQTGDTQNPVPMAIVVILSMAGAMYTFNKLKKKS